MLWITLLFALFVSLAALAYSVWPLVKPGPAPIMVEDDRMTELIGRKDAVLAAIKDLEFDYQTGKLSEEDYQRYDQRLRRQAIGLIQQIEKLAPESANLDKRLEAEIAAMRKTRDRTAVQEREPEAELPQAKVAPAGSAAQFCTNCGQPVDSAHKFCANCGTAIPG